MKHREFIEEGGWMSWDEMWAILTFALSEGTTRTRSVGAEVDTEAPSTPETPNG